MSGRPVCGSYDWPGSGSKGWGSKGWGSNGWALPYAGAVGWSNCGPGVGAAEPAPPDGDGSAGCCGSGVLMDFPP
ncbi:hypothetical protein BJF90_43485 [Pseudonocardia sp. CNS-004]|nr:hypothetical protein BJF90_43485 [Pseudonocardia sp. CNS-004]